VAASRNAAYLMLSLALVGGVIALFARHSLSTRVETVVTRVARRPVFSSLDAAPPEVREFLGRVLEKAPEPVRRIDDYHFHHWKWDGQPTHETVGFAAVRGVDPDEFIARVMDVDGYVGRIDHVTACRSVPDPEFRKPEKVRFYQSVNVPKIANVQQELVLVDAGMIHGYRVAYWYLLKDRTTALDTKFGARSEYNVGAWLVAPGVVGYALSSCPRRADVNAFQWMTLTSGANALAKSIVKGNIDGMAAWAKGGEK
jgi:hypothetical protein